MQGAAGPERSGGRGFRVRIGSFTSGGGPGITTAAVDPRTGALTLLSATDELADPSYLAFDQGTGVLYAVSETEWGTVGAFRTTPGGLHALGPAVPVGGSGPTHVSVAGRRLLTANYTSGSVSSLPIAADGSLSGPARVLVHRAAAPTRAARSGRTPTRSCRTPAAAGC